MVLTSNEELVKVLFHAKESTLATELGKSLTSTSRIEEFSWNKGKLIKLSNPCSMESMDVSETRRSSSEKSEWYAQRIMVGDIEFLNFILELELVKLLRLAIRCKFQESAETNMIFEPDIVLNAIFSASFTDTTILMKFIKKLSLKESMLIIKVLLGFSVQQLCPTNINISKPTDLQLLNWICLVYQAHMDALLLSKDKECLRLLSEMYNYILQKIEDFEEYETIQNLLVIVQKKTNMLSEPCVNAKYCIELLDA